MQATVRGQLAYAYTGGKKIDAALPSIVFIHGAANDHSVWQLQSRHFANHGFNAIAVDLPGHGKSEGGACASVGDYAAWIAEFLSAAGAHSAILAGHSMGSLIAIECALRSPAIVAGLALLGVALPMPVAEPLLDAARSRPADAFDMLNLWGHGPAAKLGRSPIPGVSLVGNYRRLLEQSRAGVLLSDLTACNNYRPTVSDLQGISCPRLIAIGMRDQMTPPKAAEAAAAQMPGTRMACVENVGHASMQEAPEEILQLLRDFALQVVAGALPRARAGTASGTAPPPKK